MITIISVVLAFVMLLLTMGKLLERLREVSEAAARQERAIKALEDCLIVLDKLPPGEHICIALAVAQIQLGRVRWFNKQLFVPMWLFRSRRSSTLHAIDLLTNKIDTLMKQFELLDGKVAELEINVTKVVDFINNPSEGPLTDPQAQGLADRITTANAVLAAVISAPTA